MIKSSSWDVDTNCEMIEIDDMRPVYSFLSLLWLGCYYIVLHSENLRTKLSHDKLFTVGLSVLKYLTSINLRSLSGLFIYWTFW